MANVKDFGAVGDGVTDDTNAIQHAFNDGDGLIEFDRGNYLVSKTIEIQLKKTGRIGIDGSGGTAKLLMSGVGPVFRLIGTHASTADPAGFKEMEWRRERNPMISNIEIEGMNSQADGIEISGVMQPTLSGVLIRKVRNALRIFDRARNVIVDHCNFYHNTGVGIFLDQVNLHQTIISNSHISYCRRGGIRIQNSEIRNLQITGNDIEYNNNRSHANFDDEPTAEIYIDVGQKGTVREGTISSNTIQATYSSQGANIRMIGASEGETANHRAGMWTISGNLIGSQKNNIHLSSVRGVTITGNYIYSGHHRNILIEKSRNIVIGSNCMGHNPDYRKNELATGIRIEDTENCNITGLLIEDAEAGKHTVSNTVQIERDALLELIRCHRVNVTGCQVLDPTPVGILAEDCNETSINHCTVLDDRNPQKMEVGIRWKGQGNGNRIFGCRIGKGTVASISADDTVKQNSNY